MTKTFLLLATVLMAATTACTAPTEADEPQPAPASEPSNETKAEVKVVQDNARPTNGTEKAGPFTKPANP